MPWRGHSGRFCHGCGRHRDECGPLSARYKCADCSERNALENHRQMLRNEGPYFDHWRRRMLAAFGVTAVDNPAETD